LEGAEGCMIHLDRPGSLCFTFGLLDEPPQLKSPGCSSKLPAIGCDSPVLCRGTMMSQSSNFFSPKATNFYLLGAIFIPVTPRRSGTKQPMAISSHVFMSDRSSYHCQSSGGCSQSDNQTVILRSGLVYRKSTLCHQVESSPNNNSASERRASSLAVWRGRELGRQAESIPATRDAGSTQECPLVRDPVSCSGESGAAGRPRLRRAESLEGREPFTEWRRVWSFMLSTSIRTAKRSKPCWFEA